MANHQPEHLGEEFKDEKTKKPSVVEKKSDEHQFDILEKSKLEGAESLETEFEDHMVFETQLEADMATLITNWFVSSVINTLAWMLYVSTEECYSGWVRTQVSLDMLICQHRFLLQMYFAVLMIFVVTYLIVHRSSLTKETKLVTYKVLFLGIVCGLLGKLCVDTLGVVGKFCLLLWAVLCLSQHVLDVFTLALVGLLYGPLDVTQGNKSTTIARYWAHGSLVFVATMLVLPLILSHTSFATVGEWIDLLLR